MIFGYQDDNDAQTIMARRSRIHPEMIKPGTISGWFRGLYSLTMTDGYGMKLSGIRMRSRLLLFCALMTFAPAAYAQDCTGPEGATGDVVYNNTFDTFQGCTTRGWMAFHLPATPDPCTTSGIPGTPCADGQTVYAGSWNGSRYYTTVADQSASAYYGAYTVDLGINARSLTDGLTNTNTALAYLESHPQAGACNTVPYNPPACAPNALVLCKNLRATLGGNWYLPAYNELMNVLQTNKVAIGGFANTPYWSSTESNFTNACLINFPSSGPHPCWPKKDLHPVRCLRRE